jgi:UrcA family protein
MQSFINELPEIHARIVAFLGTIRAYFAFAQYSCALHQSFKQQLNAGQRHHASRNPLTFRRKGLIIMRFALPLIALAALAAPALGAPSEQNVTVKIGYGDVNITTAEGRAALEARIDARVKKACTLVAASRYTHTRKAVDTRCVAEARTAALAEVEKVAALQQRSGRNVAAN